MRILVGTIEIAGQLPIYADGFRRLGHEVTTVVYQRNDAFPDIEYDVDISPRTINWPASVKNSSSLPVRAYRGTANRSMAAVNRMSLIARLAWLIANHDLFVFQWAGCSLWPGNREYPLLKRLGKRIVSVCNGDDVRHWSAYDQQNALLKTAGVSLQEMGESYKQSPLERSLRHLRMAERYSDLILSVPNQSGLGVRPYMRFSYPQDLSRYKFNIPQRDVPVIVHAPSVKSIKGTDIILPTLERLSAEGVPFELRLLHGVLNQQVLAELTEADIAIDQIHLPEYGLFGAEAMASGCALASCNREDLEPVPPNRPIWHIDSDNMYGQMKRLLTDKQLRMSLAQEGRKYVEAHHDHVRVAQEILECLERDEAIQYDFYPSFFARHYHLPEGETIPEDLKEMTTQIVQKWGLPIDVDPQSMIERGLMSARGFNPTTALQRWKPSMSPAT